jgi:hydrogenase maturation protease
MIDAAHLGEQPGVLRYLDWRQTSGLSASSHTLPLHVLASYLSAELNDPTIGLLGIQPASTAFGAPLSPEVEEALDLAEHCLLTLIRPVRP